MSSRPSLGAAFFALLVFRPVLAFAAYTLSVDRGTAYPDDPIRVCWTASPARQFDWVGIFRTGAPEHDYLDYFYTGALSAGCHDVPAPSNAGTYEFRYFPSGGILRVATSSRVTVYCVGDENCPDSSPCTANKCLDGACVYHVFGPTEIEVTASPDPAPARGSATVCWSLPDRLGSSNDWISASIPGSSDGSFSTYAFTDGGDTGCRDLLVPAAVGQYELRYHLQGSNCVVGRGGPLSVCDPLADALCACRGNQECDDGDACTTDVCAEGSCVYDDAPFEQYSIRACPPLASPGFPLTACWTAPSDHSAFDQVAWYDVSAGPIQRLDDVPADLYPDHCHTVPAPNRTLVDFRYLLGGGHCAVAASDAVQVCAGCSLTSSEFLSSFSPCVLGPGVSPHAGCSAFDLDCDERIDLKDISIYQLFFDPGTP